MVDAWNIIKNKPQLRKDISSLEAVLNLRKNTKFTELWLTDEVLSNIQSFKLDPYDINYVQALNKIGELIDALPKNTKGIPKYVGGSGWTHADQYARRSAYVTAEFLIANKKKLTSSVVEFEKEVMKNGIRSFTDVKIISSTGDIIHIETKAGDEFFSYVNSSGSNFSKQSYNMLQDANKLENVKVPLNKKVLASLDDPSELKKQKERVIKAWTNWEGDGGVKILTNKEVIETFEDFYGVQIRTSNEFVRLLADNEEWFVLMFKKTKL